MFHANTSSHIFAVDYEDYELKVIEQSHQKPVLVDLWAEWCPPCLAISPILEKIIEELDGRLLLAKVEVDEGKNMKIAGHNNVRGFPTILLMQNGEEKSRFSGAKPRHFIMEQIDQFLDLDN